MKAWVRILVVLALVVVLLAGTGLAARNILIRRALPGVVERTTGFGLKFGRIHVGILRPVISVEGMTLLNPPDFRQREAFEIARLQIEYDPRSLLSDPVRLRRVELDISRVVLVEKPDGTTNLGRLAERRRVAEPPRKAEEGRLRPAAGGRRKRGVVIDELEVGLGTVEVHRYRAGGTARVHSIEVNHRTTLYNVTRPRAALVQVASEAMLTLAARELSRMVKKHGLEVHLDEKELSGAGRKLKEALGSLFKGE
ncbi:MAG TPA: hypothetical protein EYP62_01800 [Kiritimatiellae bacterium]|nr:hypothetical protein [Kiritimatiellia bacterium]